MRPCTMFWDGPRIVYVDDGHDNEVEVDLLVVHDCRLPLDHTGVHECQCSESLPVEGVGPQ